ncbi:hypothetical protein Q4574_14490 [Aliiglaciecola sp. 3_MG-2023]|uniref:sugar phosphate isomerase/epimerase family protein n=1 Tax=Aliiglaciecola sp. 3_MG-2023 TaxID=3062644 RepID=UPI0026E1CB8A|nr:hypothetical protein [Aliiglaciecola sp. 3_MG-2023]MDO6694501.1 hypothetical protein [Aliiglaciecola sp. 3_MG-2023]
MVKLDVFQSMWAMEYKRPDGFELSLQEKIQKISDAGFKGVSFDIGYHPLDMIETAMPLLQAHGLELVYNAFVKSVEHYAEIIEFVSKQPIKPRFIAIVGQIEPWDVKEVADVTKQWIAIGEKAGITSHVEIHRNCMTNDLHFTLQLMKQVPELLMVADLSHTLVNQEYYLPLHDEANQRISEFLTRAEAFHGRVATREQIQVPFLFPQHKPWFELFQQWWLEGFENWIARHGKQSDDACVFLCELGPPVYAITGEDGSELSDRWQEALVMKETVEQLWQQACNKI